MLVATASWHDERRRRSFVIGGRFQATSVARGPRETRELSGRDVTLSLPYRCLVAPYNGCFGLRL